MSLRNERVARRLGIIEPCLPSPAKAPPSGPGWLHEIKHDGFRILACGDSAGVPLITPRSNCGFTVLYEGETCDCSAFAQLICWSRPGSQALEHSRMGQSQ